MAASSERSFLYRTSSPIQNLSLRIRCRQSHSRSAQLPGELIQRVCRWQEKRFSPWELTKYSHHLETNPGKALASRRENEILAQLREKDLVAMRRECLEELQQNSGIYIYTYVDRDDFVPAYEEERKTTSEAEDTPVAESMKKLPNRFAKLSKAGEGIQQRVTREGNFQIMYVMAAVVMDSDELENLMMNPPSGGVLNMGGGIFSELPWKKVKSEKICQEHVLCVVKMHKGGTLEVTPGLSEEEPESDDEGPFRSARSARLVAEKGPRLTTFSFRVMGNEGNLESIYQYTIENANAEMDPMKVEETLVEEGERNARAADLWRQNDADFVLPESEDKTDEEGKPVVIMRIRAEIVSAIDFEADVLYCEYQVLLPLGWTCLSESGNWHLTEQGEFTCFGSTQVAMIKDTLKRSSTSEGGIYKPLQKMEPVLAGAAPPVVLMVGILALLIGLLLGAEYMLWLWAVMFLSVAVFGVTPSHGDVTEPTAHFGLPISLHITPSAKMIKDGTYFSETPLILYQVSSIDWFGRHRIEGYGYNRLSVLAGSTDTEVSTWRPSGTIQSQLADFFIGGGHRLKDLKYVAHPPKTESGTHKRRFLSKFGFATRSSGRVRVRTHTIEQFATEKRVDSSRVATTGTRTKRVESLLNRYANRGATEAYMNKTSLNDLHGDSTAEKAAAYIRELQNRRLENRSNLEAHSIGGLGR